MNAYTILKIRSEFRSHIHIAVFYLRTLSPSSLLIALLWLLIPAFFL